MPKEALLLSGSCLPESERSLLCGLSVSDFKGAPYLASRSKRTLDMIGALLLLILILPLLAFIVLIIVATSRGGAIFSQLRYGRNMSPFEVYKFRSMRTADGAPFRQAVRGDARVTWIGRIIRKTSVDELPQLFNVLKGDMSLVGPRPHPIALDELFAPQIVGYEVRFQTLPGLTGLAQISGSRGATPTVEHMRRRIDLDLRYMDEASLALDIKILAMTVKELLFALSDKNAF